MSRYNKKYNSYDLLGSFGIGFDSNENKFYFDLEDYNKIKDYCWLVVFRERNNQRVMEKVSAHIPKNGKNIFLHHVVLGIIDGTEIDHADRNPANNMKYNLRPCTHMENMMNTSKRIDNLSGISGVSWDTGRNKWVTDLTHDGKRVLTKRFDDFYDAVKTRLLAEKEYFGEFAPQRHLFLQYGIE